MWMKRCVSTQTWQHVTANLTLPFGTVSWLHFSSKPWTGSAFTSFLQLFFVARSTIVAPSWWHRKEAFLQASLHVYDLTMASFCMELFTEVVFWHNLAFLLISFPFDLDEQNAPWLSVFCTNCNGSWFTEWRTWSAFGWFVRLVHLITNLPSLVVEQQKIVHFGSGLFFTQRC